MLKELDTYDWECAFEYAGAGHVNTLTFGAKAKTTPFTRENVKTIFASSEGENDGASWIILGQLDDERWFFLSAGCDYTGWDCRSSGSTIVSNVKDDLIRFGTGVDDRERLGIALAN